MQPSSLAVQGAGHLGTALLEGFLRSRTAPITVHNRTAARASNMASRYPEVRFVERLEAFDQESCPLLLAIPGQAILEIPTDRVSRLSASSRLVVSCCNGLPLATLEARFPSIRWAKAVPAVTASIGKSVTLVMSSHDAPELERIFGMVGSVVRFSMEEEFDRLSPVTSCLPGLLATILHELGQAFHLSATESRDLLAESALGTLLLTYSKSTSFDELANTVANPGGLTESGASVLRRDLPELFAAMKQAMDQRTEQRHRRFAVHETRSDNLPN